MLTVIIEQITDNNEPKPSQQNTSHSVVTSPPNNYQSSHSSLVQNPVEQNYSNHSKPNVSTVIHSSEDTGTSWEFVFNQLVNEIKIHHYSPKRLKAYRGYIRQLQTFTKSKNY